MKVQRIQAIENLIHEKGSISLDDLCEQFNVSKNTVRRDIAKLLQKNTIQKVYGGVVSVYNNPEEIRPFENRDTENHTEKQLIGKAAADFIEENDLILLIPAQRLAVSLRLCQRIRILLLLRTA